MVHAVVNTASDGANIRSANGLSMFQERNSGDGSRTGKRPGRVFVTGALNREM